MHAASAGLKALARRVAVGRSGAANPARTQALCTAVAADGLEECRKLCGGHGVLLASGIAQLAVDYVTYCTAEGDRTILELQAGSALAALAGEDLLTQTRRPLVTW
jgi:hypothetical protein